MNAVKLYLGIFFGVLSAVPGNSAFAQERQMPGVIIYFHTGRSDINPDYMYNESSLARMDAMFTQGNIPDIASVNVDAYVSPEGPATLNDRLVKARAMVVKRYIADRFPALPPSKIITNTIGVNWSRLRELVAGDCNTPGREKILNILDSAPDDSALVKSRLMALGSDPWNYLLTHMFPELRMVAVVTVVFKPRQPEQPQPTVEAVEVVPVPVEVPVAEPTVIQFIELNEQSEYENRPLFALKTNLLYDVMSALNIEVEVPIGKRWSVAGEWIFPWWLWKNNQTAFELLNGNLDVRYWFGDRTRHDLLTGWFAGVYGGGGYYDAEWKKQGYQGEFYSVGLVGGYAHKISRRLRMEYSLGIGYFDTRFREYKAVPGQEQGDWNLIKVRKGTDDWFGPTRVKVSLVWMLNKNVRVKGEAK